MSVIATWAAHHIKPADGYPASLLGYWKPTATLVDEITNTAGSVGGSSIATEAASNSGYALLSDGSGYAALTSSAVSSMSASNGLTVMCWLKGLAVPTTFQCYLSTQSNPTNAGWSLRNQSDRTKMILMLHDGTISQLVNADRFPTITVGVNHYAFRYDPIAGFTSSLKNGVATQWNEPSTAVIVPENVVATNVLTANARADGGGTIESGVRMWGVRVYGTLLTQAGIVAAMAEDYV